MFSVNCCFLVSFFFTNACLCFVEQKRSFLEIVPIKLEEKNCHKIVQNVSIRIGMHFLSNTWCVCFNDFVHVLAADSWWLVLNSFHHLLCPQFLKTCSVLPPSSLAQGLHHLSPQNVSLDNPLASVPTGSCQVIYLCQPAKMIMAIKAEE